MTLKSCFASATSASVLKIRRLQPTPEDPGRVALPRPVRTSRQRWRPRPARACAATGHEKDKDPRFPHAPPDNAEVPVSPLTFAYDGHWKNHSLLFPVTQPGTPDASCTGGQNADASARRAVAKRHAAAAMRGLSDTAWCAVLTELSRLCTAADSVGRVCQGDAIGGVTEAWIAFGGLTGLWTAAFVVRAVREHTKRCADAAREIIEGWDRSFLYDSAIAEDDVLEVVTWMEALDELESTHGAALLWEMAGSSDPRKRRAVAEALGECGIQSNIVIGVVAALTDDDADVVSNTANEALLKLVGDVVPSSSTGISPEAEEAHAQTVETLGDSSATSRTKNLILSSLAEQEVAAIARARAQVDAVLAASRTSSQAGAPSEALRGGISGGYSSDELLPRRLTDALRVQAPLFDWLALSELRTMCLVASLPLCYEAVCLSGGADGWLRFVGLGWLLSVAGLLAYPHSDSIWKNFEHTLAEDA